MPLALSSERIASLDFIRGIAVLGILVPNIIAFGQPMTAYMYPGAFTTPHGAVEDWMWVAQFVLFDGKMRGLFTLLFGVGVVLFLDRAEQRGGGMELQVRRLFWLGLFGLLHYYLLWRGDILFTYAVAGLLLLPFLTLNPMRQLILGVLGYCAGTLAYGAMFGWMARVADGEMATAPAMSELRTEFLASKATDLADGRLETQLIANGDYFGFVTHNLSAHSLDPLIMVLFFAFETIPLMLVGAALYRMGLFGGAWPAARVRRWAWAGLLAGTALTIPIALTARDEGLTYYGTLAAFSGWSMLPRLPVIIGLAALLALWAPHATGWLGRSLTAAGRTAFSNYLGTSMLMVLVFHGWAGGLFGALTRAELYLVVLAAWAVMLAWPGWWLARFRYGPLEWLWRCLTYGQRFPLRR